MSIIEKAMERARQERAEGKTQGSSPVVSNTDAQSSSSLDVKKIDTRGVKKDTHPLQETLLLQTQEQGQKVAHEYNIAQAQEALLPKAAPLVESTPQTDTTNGQQVQLNPIKELIMADKNTLAQGGSYRFLKEYILALRKSEPDRSLFMITSPMRNEGKTLTSCNLACALAMEFDTTVLLIDVDLRAPSCHRVLGVTNPPKGLSDCLLYDTPITDCIIHTGIGKLSFLSAGSIIANPAELITSKRMQDFLAEVKHRYPDRIIILDSLPLLPFAESRALSRMTDGVLLVVRENITYKRHLDNALQQLHDVPLLGMIYNGANTFGADKDIYNLSYYNYTQDSKEYTSS